MFTALIGPFFVDWSVYKQDFEREASRVAGQPVTVSGSASVRLLPLPSVTFTDLSVGRYEDGSPMMTVDSFSMRAELMPFLSGEIRIVDMALIQPKFTVRVNENGTVGWTDRKETILDPDSVHIEKMRIENATIAVDGLAGGRSFLGTEFNADMSAQSLFGPWNIEAKGLVEGKPANFTITTGRLSNEDSIRIRLQASQEGQPYRLSIDGPISVTDNLLSWSGGFQISALPPAVDQENDALPIRVQGQFSATPNSVDVSQYQLEIGDRTDPYTITGEGEIEIREEVFFQFFADGRQMNLDRLANTEGNAAAIIDPAARWAVVREIVDRIPIPIADGEIDFSLPAIIAGDTVIRELKARVRPDINGWQIIGLRTLFPGNTIVEADGKLGTRGDFGFTGQVLLASRQPTGFANWLAGRTNASLRRLKSAGMSADITLTSNQATFDQLELILDGVRLSGKLQRLTSSGTRPAVISSLSGETINLDDLVAIYSMTQPGGSETALSDQDIDLTLKAGLLEGRGMQASEVDAHVRVENGALSIESLNAADFYGASVTSSGKLDDFPKHLRGNFGLSIKSEQARPLVDLARKSFGTNRFLESLATDPELTRDLDVEVVVDARPAEDGSRGSLAIMGTLGGTTIDLNDRFEGTFSGWAGASHDLSIRLEQVDPAILARQLSVPVLPLDANGPILLSAEFTGNTEDGFDTLVTASAPGTEISANGNFSIEADKPVEEGTLPELSYEAALTLGSQDMDEWLQLGGIVLPGTGEGTPISLSADVTKDAGRYEISGLTGQISGISFAGELDLDGDRPGKPKLTGEMSLDELDTSTAVEMVLGIGSMDQQDLDGLWATNEFKQPVLTGLDGEVDLTAKKLTFPSGRQAEDFDAKLAIFDGSGTLAPFSFDWSGAKVTGSAALKNVAGSAVLSTQIDAKNLDAKTVSDVLGFGPVMTGTADVSLKLDGGGRSLQGLVSNLSGSGTVSISDSRFLGVTTGGFANILELTDTEEFEIAPETVQPVAQKSMQNGSFAIQEFSTPFTLNAGKLGIRNLSMEDEQGSLSGGLSLSLVDLETELDMTISPDPGEERMAAAEPEASFTWTGTPGDIDVAVDTAALQGYLSLRAYEREQRRVEILQAKALENQRLRREVILANTRINYRDRERERELRQLEEIQKKLEEERLKREAEEEAARAEEARLEEEAAEAEAERANETPESEVPAPAPPQNTVRRTPAPQNQEATTEAPIQIVRPRPRARVPAGNTNTQQRRTQRVPQTQQRPQRPLQGNTLFENLQRLFGNQ